MADELKITGTIEKLMMSAKECGLGEFVEVIKRLWINDADLIGEYGDQAALFAYCASQWELVKVDLKELEAGVDGNIRTQLEKDGTKITEARIYSEIAKASTVITMRKKVAVLGSLTEAFKQRTQMLISIGADRREEQRGTELPLPKEDRSAVLDNLQKKVLGTRTTTPSSRKAAREKQPVSKKPIKKKIPVKRSVKKK